ncbi:MAG: STAS domain-containing protein [Rickettsiales bacterium]|jgi:anti-anti-sigma factor
MVLECAGRLTIRDRKSVDRISSNITETGHSQVVIDLSKLNYIDSAGLGILLSLREGAMGKGKRIAIAGAVDSVREILDIASFGSLFDIR